MLSAIDTGLVGTWSVPAICALICLVVYWKDLLALIPRKATPPAEVDAVKAERLDRLTCGRRMGLKNTSRSSVERLSMLLRKSNSAISKKDSQRRKP